MQSSLEEQTIMDVSEHDKLLDSFCYKEFSYMEQNTCVASVCEFPGTPCAEVEKSARQSPTSNDEFWDALSSHYDYLMDDGLIATCREASSDLSWDDGEMITKEYNWSFTQFSEHFKQLHDRLHQLQVAMKENFKEGLLEELKKISLLCKNFNIQGQKLQIKYPDMQDEVNRYLNLLSNKLNAVEKSTSPIKSQPGEDAALKEIAALVRCVRRSLRELEERLCQVPGTSKIPLEKLEQMQKEQQDLQKDIKAKGKYVTALLNLCERLEGREPLCEGSIPRWNASRYRCVGKNLQKKWHSIWLQSLECQCVIEDLMTGKNNISSDGFDHSFSEEPLTKHPRLDRDVPLKGNLCMQQDVLIPTIGDNYIDAIHVEDHLSSCRKTSYTSPFAKDIKILTNDKGIMVGNTGITELKANCKGNLGKFEIIQDVGYSSETSAHFSNDEQAESSDAAFQDSSKVSSTPKINSVVEASPNTNSSSQNVIKDFPIRRLFLTPDKYPSVALRRYFSFSETLNADSQNSHSKFSKSVPDSFYKMTSLDCEGTEEDAQIKNSNLLPKSSDCCNSATASTLPKSVHDLNFSCSIDHLKTSLGVLSSSSQDSPFLKNVEENVCHNGKSNRSSKVKEWLSRYGDSGGSSNQLWSNKDAVTNSCDASGECTTTTDSDGEKSCVSDDVNNSVTFSQSFTGSVETVVKAVKDESKSHSDRAGSAEPSLPCVRLRRKKKHSRDRPWSVTELHQVSIQPPRFTHSTSEGALNAISFSQGNKSTRKSLIRKKSLTDVSVTSCPLTKIRRSAGSSSTKGENSCSDPKSAQTSNCSDHSVSSCNSAASRTHRYKHKRHLKSSHSECSSKKINSDGSSVEQKISKKSHKNAQKSPAKFSENNPLGTEDQSSVSDQVWDEYQDPPYLSEPYSEQTADEDQVKQLINFGDDYRAALGSQSDASSARSTCRMSTRSRSRFATQSHKEFSRQSNDGANSASDSDTEDFQNIVSTSRCALHFVQNCLKENATTKNFASSSEFSELEATCQTNLCHLHAIWDELNSKSNSSTFSPSDLKEFQDLIREWEVLQAKLGRFLQPNEELMSANCVQLSILDIESTMAAHKGKLNAIWTCASDALGDIASLKQLQDNIQDLQFGLATLQEMKGAVFSLSARIVRLMAESDSEAVFPLRDAASKLYQQWEDVYELSSSQLTKLQTLRHHWQEDKGKEEHLNTRVILSSSCDAEVPPSTETVPSPVKAEKDIQELFPILSSLANAEDGVVPDKEDEVPYSFINPRSQLWRVLRASLPIHIAWIISYCVSCFLEPQCCDSMNTLEYSLFPQLRHMDGPPPV